MTKNQTKSGFAKIGNAQVYYDTAGDGTPFVMIHAGVADSRQWNNEFAYFSRNYQVLRYDLRGYGKSEPADGEFNHMEDLLSLLDFLNLHEPIILMGCSMGGGLAMDFSLTHPKRVKALIMVGSGPSGLELDVPTPAKFEEADKAIESGNLDLIAEIETQIWFDGEGRRPEDVDPSMRKLAYEMDYTALSHEAKKLGERLPNTDVMAYGRLSLLDIPVLIIVGSHDVPYILACADYMIENVKFARKAIIRNAAHLPNMDQPEEFRVMVESFLDEHAL